MPCFAEVEQYACSVVYVAGCLKSVALQIPRYYLRSRVFMGALVTLGRV